MTANEKQQALDGYAKQWSGILQEGLVKETATSVAPTPGYAPGDVFTSYADGPAHLGCSVPRDLIRPDVHFLMSPSPAGGAAGMGMTANEAIDVAFDDARETDVSPSQFLQWLAGDEECRKALNAMLGSGPVKLVLGVVSARATYNLRSGGDVSAVGTGHDFDPGGGKTDSPPRQYFLILYTVTRPISPPLVRRASSTAPTRRSVARVQPQAPSPKAKGDSGPVTAQAAVDALPETAAQPPEQQLCGHNGFKCGSPRAPTTNGRISAEPAVAPGVAPTEAAALPVLPAGSAADTQSASLDATLPPAGGELRIPPPGTSTGAVSTADPAGGAINGSGVPSKSDCNGQFNRAQMLFGYSHFDRAAQAYEGAFQCAPTGEHAPLALLNLAYSYDALNRMPDMCAAIAALYRNFQELPSSIAERAGELARMGHCPQGEPRE
ncbi:MAG: hypothetical protein ACREFJ_04660 [Acetobacteraceae bacterium]